MCTCHKTMSEVSDINANYWNLKQDFIWKISTSIMKFAELATIAQVFVQSIYYSK